MKSNYKITNWKEYNKALKDRYRITLWVNQNTADAWYAKPTGNRGAQRRYSDVAIQTVLTVRTLFRLPLRGACGLLESLFEIMNLDLECPNFTTVSRRSGNLLPCIEQILSQHRSSGVLNLAIDSTGIKVSGHGEWLYRQHCPVERRKWLKLHLAVNPESHMIESMVTSTSSVTDDAVIEDLLEPFDKVGNVYVDGIYDKRECYASILYRQGFPCVIPRKDAVVAEEYLTPDRRFRNGVIRQIEMYGGGEQGRKAYKKASGYHRRSLSETAMFRMKNAFGGHQAARKFENQTTEMALRCVLLNTMTKQGMPVSTKSN